MRASQLASRLTTAALSLPYQQHVLRRPKPLLGRPAAFSHMSGALGVDERRDRAAGAVLGLLIGDALGEMLF